MSELLQHKTVLFNLLTSQIVDGIKEDNPNYLPLVKLANEQELLFPTINWTYFTMGLAKSFSWDFDYVANNYHLFKINPTQAGHFYYEAFDIQVDQVVNTFIRRPGGASKDNISAFLLNKLSNIVSAGIILPQELLDHRAITQYLNTDDQMNFKNLQRESLYKHLSSNLPDKPDSGKKMKI